MYEQPRLLPAGDSALVVEFGNEIAPEINARVRSLTAALEAESLAGVVELVPTYRSVLLHFNPLVVQPKVLEQHLLDLIDNLGDLELPAPDVAFVPVCYGGEFGPDLDHVCEHTGLGAEEVIRLHTATDYLIYMLGFTPGFSYLGGMDERLATPRLKTPRTHIPAGSTGIAGKQTGIYPIDSPGGWQLIGRTPLKLYDPFRDPPVLLKAGNYVRFVAVSQDEYEEIAHQVKAGSYQIRQKPLSAGREAK